MNLAWRLLSRTDDHPAVVTPTPGPDPVLTLTYAQLDQRSQRWRGALAAAGVEAGDRVALMAGNDQVLIVGYLAVIGLGAVAVPLNPQSPPAELARELATVTPRAAIVSPTARPAWDQAAAATTGGTHHDRGDERGNRGQGWPLVMKLADLDAGPPLAPVEVTADHPAALLFTSGTAGMPKPAVLTHANLDASVRASLQLPVPLAGADHVVVGVVPLFHVLGLCVVVNLGLAIGATLVLVDFESPGQVGAVAADHGATIIPGPPNLWAALAHGPDTSASQFATVEIALSGAAKLSPTIHAQVADTLGLDLAEGYGLTETSAVVATAVGSEAPVGSVGRLVAGVEARLVDDDGDDVLVGDPGELWVRGPMVSPGYWTGPGSGTGPELDAVVDAEGWLATGDVGVVDDDGHLSLVDRLKDLIIVSGFNVYPGEVEAVLNAHPSVAGAAVTGEPGPATGERLVAHLVAAPGATIDPDQVRAHCETNLARYKVPRRFEVVSALPVGLAGKLRRRELRPHPDPS